MWRKEDKRKGEDTVLGMEKVSLSWCLGVLCFMIANDFCVGFKLYVCRRF